MCKSKFVDWPICKLQDVKDTFLEDVIKNVKLSILDKHGYDSIQKVILNTINKERSRLKFSNWRADNIKEAIPFWNDISKKFLGASYDDLVYILESIIRKYITEIDFIFNPSKYLLICRLSVNLLSGFLSPHSLFNVFPHKSFSKRFKVLGPLNDLVSLSNRHTLVFVPTHSSNLDSIVLGNACFSIGVPPLIYSAGLNLFNSKLFSFLMGDMGTYRLDRRKKDIIYLETIKNYSSSILQNGCHSLFYPGGGRSRSGELENDLKLGLLQTTIDAQIANYERNVKDKKVIIVPVVISYSCVMEAPSIIRSALGIPSSKIVGKAFSFKSIYKYWKESGYIAVSYGTPMDILGNMVDKDGISYNSEGEEIDLYNSINDSLKDNSISSKKVEVGNKIVKEYYRKQYVLPCYVVAFIAFRLMRKKYENLSDEDFFQLDPKHYFVPFKFVRTNFILLKKVILQYHLDDCLVMDYSLFEDNADNTIRDAVNVLGAYHFNRPLAVKKGVDEELIITKDIYTLYYYHNRLQNYGFEKYV